jgi:hypothetical protein
LMRDLTLEAWYKMWLPTGVVAEGEPSCREQIDDIAK